MTNSCHAFVFFPIHVLTYTTVIWFKDDMFISIRTMNYSKIFKENFMKMKIYILVSWASCLDSFIGFFPLFFQKLNGMHPVFEDYSYLGGQCKSIFRFRTR